tara:strand:- start:1097 stop:2101 length:1005 start_codon:yes stop_codon:yes gene_type:complete
MASSKKTPILNPKKLSKEQRERAQSILDSLQNNVKNQKEVEVVNPPGSTLNNAKVFESIVFYDQSPNEKVIKHGDAYITFGADKPAGGMSGYGAKGAVNAARIDLVVGRMAAAKPDVDSYAGNSFQADAARIYISQLTDIDKNFGIDDGYIGEIKERSGIGIKADAVRVIGREGVKIVTGRMRGTGEKNSLDGKMIPAPSIELIAGNNSEPRRVPGSFLSGETEFYQPLQGVAMGHNTVVALQDLSELISNLVSILKRRADADFIFNTAVNAAMQLPPPLQGAAIAVAYAAHTTNVLKTNYNLWQFFVDKALWDVNYTQPFGYRYIESRNVRTT